MLFEVCLVQSKLLTPPKFSMTRLSAVGMRAPAWRSDAHPFEMVAEASLRSDAEHGVVVQRSVGECEKEEQGMRRS